MVAARAAKATANGLKIRSSTKNRVGDTQTCPALRDFATAETSPARSGSTSPHTMTGAWPPSSMIDGFICWAARLARCLPTGTEPVKVTRRTVGCGIRWAEMSAGFPNTRFSTPARKPGIVERTDQLDRTRRRLFRRLEDDRAAGRQGARHFACRGAHREVPGREAGDDADRLAQHAVAHARLARDNPAIKTPPFVRVPLDDLTASQDFYLCLRQRLSLLERDGFRDRVHPLPQEPDSGEDDLRALRGRRAAPQLEALGRGIERGVEVGRRRVRDDADLSFVRRIDHGLTIGALPGAADIKLNDLSNISIISIVFLYLIYALSIPPSAASRRSSCGRPRRNRRNP